LPQLQQKNIFSDPTSSAAAHLFDRKYVEKDPAAFHLLFGCFLKKSPASGTNYYNCKLILIINFISGVLDPDPYVFGPPGSGFFIISTDPDPSHISKNSRRNLDYGTIL
jgi:hypothetical protein